MKTVFDKKAKKLIQKQESILSVFSKAKNDLEAHLEDQKALQNEIHGHIAEQKALLNSLECDIEQGHATLRNFEKFLGNK